MAPWRERLGELREAVEERVGYTTVPRDKLEILEARSEELGYTRRELDALAWTALDYVGGSPQEIKAIERRKLTQKARIVWMKDPQAGAAVDLMNDFVFGRGLPKPKASDEKVQEVIDEAWEDPDNQLVLTSFQGQLAIGTDLSLQSNLYILVFDDGEDGKVKLGLLDHDAVENAVKDPENRLRVMYYVARHYKQEWDYDQDQPFTDLRGRGPADAMRGDKGKGELRYYAHWRNVEDAEKDAEKGFRDKPDGPPEQKLGDGKVFHISLNRTSEMAFGHPVFDRLLRWFNAYNTFMDARLDIIQAKAAFVMKRKIKGTPNQLQKMAQQAVSRRSALGSALGVDDPEIRTGPRPASILNENEGVSHEDMNFDTGAGNALQDGQMLRAQVSAATRFPQTYYGDASNSTLATATSLELPVLKAVESRQEMIESLVRFFIDRVIERAVDTGRISSDLSPEERAALEKEQDPNEQGGADMMAQQGGQPVELTQALEDQAAEEENTARDLSYEFQMPSPLKRLMNDLVGAVMNTARTFDPNNTNMELSRVLLGIVLGDALEMEDPQKWVEKIFPDGYVDPAVAAAQAAAGGPAGPPSPFGEFAPVGPDGQAHPNPANPYGAPMNSTPPEQASLQAARISEGAVTLGRDGTSAVRWPRRALLEARVRDMPLPVRNRANARTKEIEDAFAQAAKDIFGSNGNGG